MTAADRCAFTGIREAFTALRECFVDASHLIKEMELIAAHTEASKIPSPCVCVRALRSSDTQQQVAARPTFEGKTSAERERKNINFR